jgi:hypothetical protein
MTSTRVVNNSAYEYMPIQAFNSASSGGATTGVAFHIAGRMAPVIRAWTGEGTGLDVGNFNGTGYEYIGASSFPVRSSERYKKNIAAQPDEEIIPNSLSLLSCRTVTFDDNYDSGYWDEDEQTWKSYDVCDCPDCEDCQAVKNSPLQSNHFNRRGMIAEELAEVCPQAVHVDAEGIPNGIDYAVLTVELLDAVKLLVLQCENQERRIAELEAQ